MNDRVTIDITSGAIFRMAAVLLALWFLWFIRDILLFLLLAVIIASALEPLAARLQQFRIPRPLSVLAVYAVVIAILGGIGSALIPALVSEIRELASALPALYEQFTRLLGGAGVVLGTPEAIESLRTGLLNLGDFLTASAGEFFATTKSLFGSILAVFLVFVVSFYLVVNRNGLVSFIRSVTPLEHQAYVIGLVERAQRKIARWAGAQLLLGLIIAVVVYLGLWALGIPYALALALLAGLLELIPVIGPIIAAIPAVLVGFTQSVLVGVLVLLLYVVIQQLENHALVPMIMRRAVGLNPLVTILAVLIGAKLAGFLGILLAVPVATILAVFLADIIPTGREEELPA
ncbi:MAG: AI-2E family transporter [bacterium]|nr:AI-2E family transporter [bacterium]